MPLDALLRPSPTLAIDLGRRRLQAMLVRPKGARGVTVVAAVEAMLPAGTNPDDAEAVGAWVASTLADAGIPRRPAVVALPREQIGLKTMMFPTTDRDELPSMVRLATQRELPLDGGDPAIDFVPMRSAVAEGMSSLLVAAAPARTMAWVRAVMRAAGIRIARVTVRTVGVGALIRGQADASDGGRSESGGGSEPTLVLDLTGEGLELALVVDGAVQFSRGVTIPSPPGEPPSAEAIVTEVKRSWVSYRIGAETEDARAVMMLGSPAIVGEARGPISTIVGREAAALAAHPAVDIGDHAMGRLWPLAGLLIDARSRGPHLDLAHPRRAPDLAARRRQRMLLAAGALGIAALVGHTIGSRSAEREAERLDDLRSKAEVAAPEARRIRRDMLKLVHLEAWHGIRRDWVADLTHLKSLMPEPGQVVTDSLVLSLENPGVSWHRERGWSLRADARVNLEGEAATRTVADAFRETLVKDERFVTTTSGSDARGGRRLPYPFGYLMRSSETTRLDEAATLRAAIGTGADLADWTPRGDGDVPEIRPAVHEPNDGAMDSEFGLNESGEPDPAVADADSSGEAAAEAADGTEPAVAAEAPPRRPRDQRRRGGGG